MKSQEATSPLRILVADDDEIVLDLYEAFLRPEPDSTEVEVVCCRTAEDAVERVEGAGREGRPFAIAFLDVRMPDGEEGIWAAERIRGLDPNLEIVIATAFSDLDPASIAERVPPAEQLLYLEKPFHSHEINQLASCLGAKWRSRRQLHQSQLRLTTAQRIARFAYFEWNLESRETWWPDELCELFGLEPGANTGPLDSLFKNLHPADEPALREALTEVASGRPAQSVGYRIVLPDGEERHFQQESIAVGRQVVSAVQDVSAHKELERQIRRLAFFDDLTGLPNRSFLLQHLVRVLDNANRQERKVALLFLDLDNFKRVNDTFGHGAGDTLLREVASRLTHCVRSSDCVARRAPDEEDDQDDTDPAIARLGGDEFIVFLSELRDLGDAARVAERILEALSRPISVQNVEVSVGTSIGIALYPSDGADGGTLLKNADSAMYDAKSAGKNTYRYYRAELNEAAFRRLALESEMVKTVGGEQMSIVYQPLMELATGRLAGAEALLRWEHPVLGEVSPDEFIPVAEETGLIVQLGRWILRRTCEQIRTWSRLGLELRPVSVNMSFRQFRDRRLLASIREILTETGVSPELLSLEFTETVLMDDMAVTQEILQDLKDMGVRAAMDDFGTGYSSLSHLKRLPLDRLKIDRCFVADLTRSADDQAIVAAIIALAHRMHLEVVAEGVETQEQAALLESEGCELMQGFLVSAALPPEEFAARFLAAPEKAEAD